MSILELQPYGPTKEQEKKTESQKRSWQALLWGPSGDRIESCCCHTGPDLTIRIWCERQDRKTAIIAICFGPLAPSQTV